MPLTRLQEGDILIASELNGEPLAVKNGFVSDPGYYGTNNTKMAFQAGAGGSPRGQLPYNCYGQRPRF